MEGKGNAAYMEEVEGNNETRVDHIRTATPITQAGKLDRNTRTTPGFKIKQDVNMTTIETWTRPLTLTGPDCVPRLPSVLPCVHPTDADLLLYLPQIYNNAF